MDRYRVADRFARSDRLCGSKTGRYETNTKGAQKNKGPANHPSPVEVSQEIQKAAGQPLFSPHTDRPQSN